MKPRISVIVPVYNAEEYISSCLDSIINQTLKEIEIIIINDGSKDNSGKIIDHYSKLDNRINVIHKNNEGLSATRNMGIKISNGEYITFIDSDDYVELNMLESMYEMAKNNGYLDIVASGIKLNYENESYIIDRKVDYRMIGNNKDEIGNIIFKMCELGLYNLVCTKLYKRSFIEQNSLLFFKEDIPAEDVIFNSKAFMKCRTLGIIDKSYYNYMKRDIESMVNRYYERLSYISKERYLGFKYVFDYYNLNNDINIQWLDNAYINEKIDVLLNIYRRGCTLTNSQKISYINKNIIKDKEIKNKLKCINSDTLYKKIFSTLYIMNNSSVMFYILNILFYIRNNYSRTYLLYRKYIVNRKV